MSMRPSLLASTRATMAAASAAETAMPSRFSDSSSSPAVMKPSPSWSNVENTIPRSASRSAGAALSSTLPLAFSPCSPRLWLLAFSPSASQHFLAPREEEEAREKRAQRPPRRKSRSRGAMDGRWLLALPQCWPAVGGGSARVGLSSGECV
uniref:Uncharacterized protein n=1 Tax=Triticum urartu TaxID=4572 RepID=A0A8R7V2D2_TRIUA